ncbi:hypothetical protein [Clostridium estertheticum]|uniref:hypothetical protein n=1 Tax=Clostridium estertheticum TaxID=238834 RepID=UPI001C0D4AEB|nr:hypothetical protein [Clostridium estertheticum]MBU3186655.1 hypothetical protein [Clostridium estertheticum]
MAKDSVGFIIDAPNCLIKSSKGDLIIDKASSGEVSFSGDNISITGGQGFLSLAEIPKSTKIDVKITNAEFSMNQLALTSGSSVKIGVQEFTKFGDIFVVDATNKITIPDIAVAGSVRLNDFTETSGVVATKQFKVTIAADSTELEFFTDVTVGTELKPSYKVATPATTVAVAVKTTDVPGSAEVVLTWPIYESDTVESAIWGSGQLTLYKAKINQSSKIGGSYKTASQYDLAFSTLDPKRPDKLAWNFIILPLV